MSADEKGKPSDDYMQLKNEVGELRSALATVTESLVLFQEFVEAEICEMTYFRESGAFDKLAMLLNNIRKTKYLNLKPVPKLTPLSAQIQEIQDDNVASAAMDVNSMTGSQTVPIMEFASVLASKGNEPELVDEGKADYSEKVEPLKDFGRINHVFSISPKYHKPFGEARNSINVSNVLLNGDSHDLKPTSRVPDGRIGNPAKLLNILATRRSLDGIPPPYPDETRDIMPMSLKDGLPLPLALTSNPELSVYAYPIKAKVASTPSNQNIEKPASFVKSFERKTLIKNPFQKKAKLAQPPKTSSKPKGRSKNAGGPVTCPQCRRGYSSRGVLSRHQKEVHQKDPQFQCFYCPLHFRTGPARLDHMNTFHAEEMKSVICPYCNRISASSTGKRNHMMLCPKRNFDCGAISNDGILDLSRKRRRI